MPVSKTVTMRWMVLVLAAVAGCAAGQPLRQGGATPGPPTGYNMQALSDFDEAVALTSQLRYSEAEVKLASLLAAFESGGDHRRASETLFWLGYCDEKQGRPDQARDIYQRLAKDFPGSPVCRQASLRLANLPPPAGASSAGRPSPASAPAASQPTPHGQDPREDQTQPSNRP